MTIAPASPLGPRFARGWRKLPEELKLRVLQHNLTSLAGGKTNITILVEPASMGDDLYNPRSTWKFFLDRWPDLNAHLAMGPEIAQLATDVFYKRNTFALSDEDVGTYRFPPRCKRPAVCGPEEIMEMNWFLDEAGKDKETAQREFMELLIFDQ